MAFLKTQLIFQGPVLRRVNLKSHIQNVSSTLGKLSFQLSISPALLAQSGTRNRSGRGKCLLSGIFKKHNGDGIRSVFESGEHKTCNHHQHHPHHRTFIIIIIIIIIIIEPSSFILLPPTIPKSKASIRGRFHIDLGWTSGEECFADQNPPGPIPLSLGFL